MVKRIRLFLQDFKARNAGRNHEDQMGASTRHLVPNLKKEERKKIQISPVVQLGGKAGRFQRVGQWNLDIPCWFLFWSCKFRTCACVCALVSETSLCMLVVIYITCLHSPVCILLQPLTFLPLSSGTLLALSASLHGLLTKQLTFTPKPNFEVFIFSMKWITYA